MIRWGVIGAGGFADKRPIPALKKADNCHLHAVMVRDLEKARLLAQKHGVQKYYNSVDDLLADRDIDAVYISTPVYLHREHTFRAARAGKHILCEKPMALNVKEAEEMAKVCSENNCLFMPGFMLRFHASHLKIKELIQKGILGQVVSARAQLYLWYPDMPGAWRQSWKTGGGGCLMDVGSHCLDLLCFFLGEVDSVAAIKDTITFNYEVEDTIHILLKFRNRSQAVVDTGFSVPYRENFLEIYGTKGTILARKTIGPFTEPVVRLITEKGEKDISLPYQDTYQAEFAHFTRCIEEGKTPDIQVKDGIYNLTIIENIYKSADSGQTIKVKK